MSVKQICAVGGLIFYVKGPWLSKVKELLLYGTDVNQAHQTSRPKTLPFSPSILERKGVSAVVCLNTKHKRQTQYLFIQFYAKCYFVQMDNLLAWYKKMLLL